MISHKPTLDSMALAIKNFSANSRSSSRSRGNQRIERPFCTHCRVQGHHLKNCFKAGNAEAPVCTHCHFTGYLAEKCNKLLGYPPGHKLFNKSKSTSPLANRSSISTSTDPEEEISDMVGLTKGPYQQLLNLL